MAVTNEIASKALGWTQDSGRYLLASLARHCAITELLKRLQIKAIQVSATL